MFKTTRFRLITALCSVLFASACSASSPDTSTQAPYTDGNQYVTLILLVIRLRPAAHQCAGQKNHGK